MNFEDFDNAHDLFRAAVEYANQKFHFQLEEVEANWINVGSDNSMDTHVLYTIRFLGGAAK